MKEENMKKENMKKENMKKEKVKERIKLEKITKEETPLIVKWRNNPRVIKNFIHQQKLTEETHNNWINTKIANGEVVQFIIRLKENNKAIGTVFLKDINNEEKQAEYGIFIGEDEEIGKGYGTEAARLAIEYGFEKIGLEKIILRVFADNKSAINSYKKVGFTEEKYIKDAFVKEGKYRDLIFMKIDRSSTK